MDAQLLACYDKIKNKELSLVEFLVLISRTNVTRLEFIKYRNVFLKNKWEISRQKLSTILQFIQEDFYLLLLHLNTAFDDREEDFENDEIVKRFLWVWFFDVIDALYRKCEELDEDVGTISATWKAIINSSNAITQFGFSFSKYLHHHLIRKAVSTLESQADRRFQTKVVLSSRVEDLNLDELSDEMRAHLNRIIDLVNLFNLFPRCDEFKNIFLEKVSEKLQDQLSIQFIERLINKGI